MIQYVFSEKKFIPDYHLKTFGDIDFDRLLLEGTDVLLIDVDNTLIPYDKHDPDETLKQTFAGLKEKGFHIVLISNNHKPRIKRFSEQLSLPYVYSAKKPLKGGFKKALKKLDNPNPKQVIVIGDQLMTDVFGAKRMGFKAIWLSPIKRKTEKWYTKLNRKMEKTMLDKIKKKAPETYQNLSLEER